MPWTDVTLTRTQIMGALGLPMTAPNWVEWTQRALNRLEAYNGQFGINLIADYVAKYEAAQTALNAGAGDQGIKTLGIGAGIEYFERGATAGYRDEMNRYRNLLLDTLFWEGEKEQIRRNSAYFNAGKLRIRR